MKKTLITLMALAGVAMANSKVVEPAGLILQINDDQLAWVDANNTTSVVKAITSTNATLNDDGSFTTNGSTFTGESIGDMRVTKPGISMDTFTLTFTADWSLNASGETTIFSWGEPGNGEWGFELGINSSGMWNVTQKGYGKSVEITQSGVAAVDGGAQEYTVIGRMEAFSSTTDGFHYTSSQGRYHVEIYEGESLIYGAIYADSNNKMNFGQGYQPKVLFGAGLAGTNASQVVVSNATLYIPEPATATLSLLALAGLAARRRRK